MRRYGIFVSCTLNYIQYLTALIASMEKRKLWQGGHDLDLHILYEPEIPESYIITTGGVLYSSMIVPVIMDKERSIFKNETSRNRFAKLSRFEYMSKMADHYDVACLLDADMMIVSHEFMNLFDLVYGTDKLIGCNEKFKWVACSDKTMYMLDDAPIFPEPTQLWKFMCSVPTIFNMEAWRAVFDDYLRLVSDGYQLKEDGERQPLGDMFSWNLSVRKNERQNDLILFPMETMTQVHYTNTDPYRRVVNNDGYWHTIAGDPVYTLHGRMDKERWESEHWRVFEMNHGAEAQNKYRNGVAQSISACKKEWNELSNNGKLQLEGESQESHIEKPSTVKIYG